MNSKPKTVVFNPPFEKAPVPAAPLTPKPPASPAKAKNPTEPTSPEVKDQSSQNAVNPGLLARSAVAENQIAAESAAEFEALLAGFRSDLKPTGPMEDALVERIATCHWRLARAHRFETFALDHAPDNDPMTDKVEDLRFQLDEAQKSQDALVEIAKIYGKPAESLCPEERAQLNEWEAQVAARVRDDDADDVDDDDEDADSDAPDDSSSPTSAKQELVMDIKALGMRITALLKRLGKAEFKLANRNFRSEKSSLLPDSRDLLNLIRYESMLDRQLHRALVRLARLRAQRSPRGPRHHRVTQSQEEPVKEQPLS